MPAPSILKSCVILLITCLLSGCATGRGGGCNGVAYPEQAGSDYVLPWSVGETYAVVNGNCGVGRTHNGDARFSYDFEMPVGTTIRAARGGTVIGVRENFSDYNAVAGDENWLFVMHPDGTVARYYHLTQRGSLVSAGSEVSQGDAIALSGATGYIGFQKIPHLHFDVTKQECGEEFFGKLCETIPITFRNTRPHPGGLVNGEAYTASR